MFIHWKFLKSFEVYKIGGLKNYISLKILILDLKCKL